MVKRKEEDRGKKEKSGKFGIPHLWERHKSISDALHSSGHPNCFFTQLLKKAADSQGNGTKYINLY